MSTPSGAVRFGVLPRPAPQAEQTLNELHARSARTAAELQQVHADELRQQRETAQAAEIVADGHKRRARDRTAHYLFGAMSAAMRRMQHSRLWQAFNGWLSAVEHRDHVGAVLWGVEHILRQGVRRQLSHRFERWLRVAVRTNMQMGHAVSLDRCVPAL